MNRRRVLLASGAALSAGSSGCTESLARARTRTMDPSEVDEEEDETHLLYRDDGDRIAAISITDRWRREGRRTTYPIRTHVWHADGTHLDRLRYAFRPQNPTHPPEFYLKRPGGSPWKPITFSRGDGSAAAVLDIPELGFQGRGSVTLDLLVEGRDEEPFDLRVDVEATLDSGSLGRGYDLRGTIVREIPGGDRS